MSPFRARKALNLGPWLRVNFTARSVVDWLRDWLPDGHVAPGRRPWSSITVGPRGFSFNTRRRTARVDLPGPFSYETPRLGGDDAVRLIAVQGRKSGASLPGLYWQPTADEIACSARFADDLDAGLPIRWTDSDGRRWEQTQRSDGGTDTRYLPDPVTDEEALEQACPRCGAEPQGRCRTRQSGRPTDPHMPRVELARLARAYPEPRPHEHDVSCPDFCPDLPPWGTRPADQGDDRP